VKNDAFNTSQYTGGQIAPTKSEFKQVLKRRKSRQSTDMYSNVDFELVGNSPFMYDFIKKDNKW
jgi:hypothetical protein